MRRIPAATLALALVLVTSGCMGAITGETIAFEASPATLSEDARGQYGYEETSRDSFTVEREAELPVVGTRTVRITNHVAAYTQTSEDETAPPSVVYVVSTPEAAVAGQGLNPLGRIPAEELVDRLGDRLGGEREIESVGTESATILGTETEVEKFAASPTDEDSATEYLYVARVNHDGDYVIVVGVLPEAFEDQESALLDAMSGVEH